MIGRSPSATPTNPKTARTGRGLLSRLRDAPLRAKLGLILVIPVTAVMGLATIRLVDRGQQAGDADLVHSLAALSADASDVSHQLQKERMASAAFLAGAALVRPADLQAQVQRTDQAVNAYNTRRAEIDDAPPAVADRLVRVDQQLAALAGLRDEVVARRDVAVSETVLRYGVIIGDLLAYRESVGQFAGDSELADSIRAAAALSKAKVQMSETQAVAFVALLSGQLDQEQLASFLATLTGQQEALLAFSLTATPQQRATVNSTITGDAVVLADRTATEVIRSVGQRARISAEEAFRSLGSVVDLVRWVEQRLDTELVDAAKDLRDSVVWQVLAESIAVLIVLVLAVVLALVLARILVRSLSRLREGALTVVNVDLPQTVSRLSDPQLLADNTPEEIAAQVHDPIQLGTRDEIGQVASAFNVVHREAVRVAAEQAALSTSVSAMFLNLARRSQSLVDRMIGQLDEIERHEEDPKRLSRLFTLDHLATRMRRNDENLLVLAGADSSPARRDPALVVDVLRAAQSEVENYDRIEFGTVDTDVSVTALAVNDVVRLIAELFDNAAHFSPPDAAVVAEARRVGDQVIVQVEDRGVGMSDEQVSRLNARLAQPPAVDITAFRMMGLAVVGRLAARYDIKVELRCDPGFGTMVYVTLPTPLLILPRMRGQSVPVVRPRVARGTEVAPGLGHERQLPPRPPTHPLPAQLTPAEAAGAVAEAMHHNVPVAGGPPSHLVEAGVRYAEPAAVHAPPTQPPTPLPTRTPIPTPAPIPAPRPVAPQLDDTTEMPIFREIEAVWFRSHGRLDIGPDVIAPTPVTPTGFDGDPVPVHAASHTVPSQRSEPAAGPARQPGVPGYPPGMPGAAPGYPPEPPGYASGFAPPPRPAAVPSTPAVPAPAVVPPPFVPPPVAPPGMPPPVVPAAAPAPPTVPHPAATPAATGTAAHRDPWRTAADRGWQAAAAAAEPQIRTSTRSGLPKRVPQAQLVPGAVEVNENTSRGRRSPDEVRGLLSAYHRGVQRGRANREQ